MSEECTHDCSTCGSSCEHVDAKDLIAPLNKDSSIKHVYAIMSGKGGVGKSSTTASLATAMRLPPLRSLLHHFHDRKS